MLCGTVYSAHAADKLLFTITDPFLKLIIQVM
jgi:hypothetical protein